MLEAGGSIGHTEACADCYNKFDADQSHFKAAQRVADRLVKVNQGLQEQNVAQDRAIENDERVIELRAEVARLKARITQLEMQVAKLNELARG